jgi:hypothetical protein
VLDVKFSTCLMTRKHLLLTFVGSFSKEIQENMTATDKIFDKANVCHCSLLHFQQHPLFNKTELY